MLRITIGNTRRAEVLLHPGEAARAVRIELTSADLTRSRLVVSFSLQGTGANLVCTNDHSVEAVVEIETTSALFLALDAPLETPRDRTIAWGDQLRIEWTGDTSSLLQAVDARRANISVLFVPEAGLGHHETAQALRHLLANRGQMPFFEFAWSEAMDPTGNLYGLRRFEQTYTWRIPYNMDRAQRLNLPRALELAMFLPPHPMGADWQITVTHTIAYCNTSQGPRRKPVSPQPSPSRRDPVRHIRLRSQCHRPSYQTTDAATVPKFWLRSFLKPELYHLMTSLLSHCVGLPKHLQIYLPLAFRRQGH